MGATDTMIADFNAGQLAGIEKVVKWFKGDRYSRKPVFFLNGDAGTGKTAFAKEAARSCVSWDHQVVFIAPTGKAASRLRQKGCKGAKTMHQFIYNVRGEDEDGDPIFAEKAVLKESPHLIVLDEASMVNEYDFQTLMRKGIPILALGDLKQVRPVKGKQFLTEDNADHTLTEIMRQAAGSNILRAAQYAAQGKALPEREYEDVRVRFGSPTTEELIGHAGEDAQIVCSYNTTRVGVNREVRKALGFTGDLPSIGEKVMCWFNQHEHNFMNGEQGIVLAYEEIREADESEDDEDDGMLFMRLRSLTDGRDRRVKFNPKSFSNDPEEVKEALKKSGGFQYGYCGTVHKCQGSEWDNVLVIEEPMGDYKTLMYTAFTRAAKRLTIRRPGRNR